MSEKRIRRPATKCGPKPSNQKASTALLAPEPVEGQSAVGAELERVFESIFEYVRERDEAKERARAARPRAQIILFPKARE